MCLCSHFAPEKPHLPTSSAHVPPGQAFHFVCLVWELIRCQLCSERWGEGYTWNGTAPFQRSMTLSLCKGCLEQRHPLTSGLQALNWALFGHQQKMAHRAQPCGAALLDITPPDHQAELSVAREQMWGSGCCQNTTKRALNLVDMRTNPIVMSAVEVQTGNTE